MAVIACKVLADELAHYAEQLPQIIATRLLEQGLHDEPDRLRTELQAAIDAVEAEHEPEAIVLGYGLCSRGTEGLRTRRARLVLPRAHDCITLLLGSKERYARYVAENPGTYWYSPGWNSTTLMPGPERHRILQERYREQFEDEEDVAFLMEQEQHWFHTYKRATHVDLGAGDCSASCAFAERCADWLGWDFDRVQGDPALLQALLEGSWDDERFLVLEPGWSAQLSGDERVVRAVPPKQEED
ncbi:MAG: DUF1638 domain-containing protein [Planctomycetota bacterium]